MENASHPSPLDSSNNEMEDIFESSGVRFDGFRSGNQVLSPQQVEQALAPLLSDERKTRIEEVLTGRTYQIVPVVEGLVNTGNVSAVMRTAEGLGFQPFHVIRNEAKFKKSVRTSQGAHKWLDVHLWDSTPECVSDLKKKGYQVVVTHLDDSAIPLSNIDLTIPTALVFGNEKFGVSEEMLRGADYTAILPSPGFVQSYNISVAAAMTLFAAHDQRTRRFGHSGDLSEEDKQRLRADFYMRSVGHAEEVLKRHLGIL